MRYWDFKDQVRDLGIELPKMGEHVTFLLPMPKSWSIKKRDMMRGGPHEQTPDLDNLLKALGDSIYKNDSVISDIRITKAWADSGKILMKRSSMPIRPVNSEYRHDEAIKRIEMLFGAEQDTPEGDELDVLLVLVRVYEQENHPVPPPTG